MPHALRLPIARTPRALWKLHWFLRDFGYDTDLLGRDEVDERHTGCSLGSLPAKKICEIQYLRATITDEQRREFGQLAEATTTRIASGDFPPHTGIRFPQNGCASCPYLGICLGSQALTETKLVRQPGASELDWVEVFDE